MKKSSYLTEGAIIAAVYVVLTLFSAVFGLSGGVIQLRLSEAMCVLPLFTPAAVPGLFVGCIIANMLTGAAVLDVIFGSVATLAAAFAVTRMKKLPTVLASVPNIAFNTVAVPLVLRFVYHAEEAMPLIVLSVFLGEVMSSGVLGYVLATVIKKRHIMK